MTINFHKGFDDLYLIEKDINIEEAILQEEEVVKLKWAEKEEIIELINSDKFIPYYPSFIELVFDMKQRHNTISNDDKKFIIIFLLKIIYSADLKLYKGFKFL